MKFIYNSEEEIQIFKKIKEQFKEPSASLWQHELENVRISATTSSSVIKKITKDWSKVEDNFLRKLGVFYEKVNLAPANLDVFLVRFTTYPYHYTQKGGWFCAPLFSPPAERIRVVMHELCHFYQPKKLPKPIKEAIPIILNDHDMFQMFSIDKGHNDEEEQKWRKIIWDGYKSGKTLSQILQIQ